MKQGGIMKRLNNKGFGAVGILAILIVLALLSIGWYVWQRNQKEKSSPPKTSTQPEQQQSQNKPDPYEGWSTYQSSSYGINFRYPPGWKAEEIEGLADPSSSNSLLAIERGVYLKRDKEEKYNNTISIDIHAQDIAKVSSVYESLFAQASTTQVTTTTENLKGKSSVQFKIHNSEQTRHYLFAVGNKTYVFSSINESFNIYNDAEYWAKFDKVFESFKFVD